MATYYISACHKCKERVMWAKCPLSQAEKWHEEYEVEHKGHWTQMSNDYDDEFYDKIWEYKSLGIRG